MAFFDFLRQSKREAVEDRRVQKIVAEMVEKSFSLKSPGPMQKFAADLLGVDDASVVRPYAQSIWVYACINIWARISTIPLQVLDSNGNEVTTGPEKFLINSPSSALTTSEFIEYIILSLGTAGQYFILREDGTQIEPNRLPKYFTVVAPNCMTLTEGDVDKSTGKVKMWTMGLGSGATRKIPAAGVITSMFPNPYRTHIGLSPLEAVRLTVDGDYAARTHNKWLMERHGRISGIVSFQESVGKDRLTQMAEMWRRSTRAQTTAARQASWTAARSTNSSR
jgi:phage portal protein BeeE